MESEFSNDWERSLVEVAWRKLRSLRRLDDELDGDRGTFDVNGAVNGVWALTDLSYEQSFNFSEAARLALSRINEEVTELLRARAARPYTPSDELGDMEVEPALALYNAILSNLPKLEAGKSSRHALALSKATFDDMKVQCANRPRIGAAISVICVHDYGAMQLANRPRIKG